MNLKIIFFIFIPFGVFASSINSHGHVGYINIPSAFSLKESSINLMVNRNEPDRKISLTASPLDWLDANIFYVDITGKPYGGGYKQSNKDKGFSFKASLGKIYGHQFAIGVNDIAGTGYFSSEYLVLSKRLPKFEYSIGIGWGNYSSGLSINNPLSYLSDRFKTRSSKTKDKGGSPDYNNYFSGKNASLFLGGAYSVNDKNKIFFEYDPTSLDRIDYPDKHTRLNIGHEIKFGNTYIKTSWKRGSILNIQIDNREFKENKKHYQLRLKKKAELDKVEDHLLKVNQLKV